MSELLTKNKFELSVSEVIDVLCLLTLVWGNNKDATITDKQIEKYKSVCVSSFNKVFLLYKNKELIGHTEIFQRDIIIDAKEIPILALAGVCVRSDNRGQKNGYKMVKKAFEYVDNDKYGLSIFQTNIPEFYLKLNCKLIDNKFINSKSNIDINANPWRDPFVMIYSNDYKMRDGIIDLNGECY